MHDGSKKMSKNKTHYLHLYGERRNGQWTVMCLDFSLAVQSNTLSDAQKKIYEQIEMYLKDALEGPDKNYAYVFLNRSAPAKYWMKYYWFSLVKSIFKRKDGHLVHNLPRSFATA